MSVIEQSREMTQQDKIDWDYSYTQAGGFGKIIPNPIDYMIITCCSNCKFFAESEMEFAEGFCIKNISNELGGGVIINSDTFYCSYHKFRV